MAYQKTSLRKIRVKRKGLDKLEKICYNANRLSKNIKKRKDSVMLNYKECDIKDFESAMKQKNADIKTISNEHLYILYTKFKADATACAYAGTSYASGLSIDSKNQAQRYADELKSRNISI